MRWQGLALAMGLVACSPAPEEEEEVDLGVSCDATAAAPASIPALEVLGETSEDHYEPLSPDAVLVRHSGPQGGQHFWIRVRLFSPSESLWHFDAQLVDANGETLATGSRGFTSCEGKWSKPREITVFIEEPYAAFAGTLSVTSTNPELAPVEIPVSVP